MRDVTNDGKVTGLGQGSNMCQNKMKVSKGREGLENDTLLDRNW